MFPLNTDSQKSLVMILSSFEATRELFWDGPRNFEQRLDDEDGTTFSRFSHHTNTSPSIPVDYKQREDVSPYTYDSACNRPVTRWIFNGIGFRIWKPSGFEAGTLPLGHRGLGFIA
ncbi:hypothetical protein AVEN_35445-1 [Araneus ventricosus]|uniref:Uncharacterized protein n=1 Tax=Araneus ventricosus TaxID=182803 RepID=A0A4Y2R5N5_ARAVE|nr:hypothetical protein AVEN_35445-1 [Araneus ventricosus]